MECECGACITVEAGTSNGTPYDRSDSMPGASASIRLALEEKRRHYNTQRATLNAQLAKEREQKSRQAFFTLLGKAPTPTPTDQRGMYTLVYVVPVYICNGSFNKLSHTQMHFTLYRHLILDKM